MLIFSISRYCIIMAPTKKNRSNKKNVSPKKKKLNSVNKNRDFLKVFIRHGKSKKDIKKLVDLANKEEINAICEILFNAMRGNIRLTPTILKKLQKNKKACNLLIRRDVSFTRKKKILKGQAGGFIGAILGSLGSMLVTPIVESVVNSFK